MSEGKHAVRTVRATGFVSAVLLVVLLATTGWPSEAHPLVDNTYVTSCEGAKVEVSRVARSSGVCVLPQIVLIRSALPRVRPRQHRVDSWGLPPPRAPTI